MQGRFAESYQPLGNLRLDLTHSAPSKNFRRQLDLDTACVTVSYEVEDVQFKREAFVSAPDQVLVLRSLQVNSIRSAGFSPLTVRSRRP